MRYKPVTVPGTRHAYVQAQNSYMFRPVSHREAVY